MVPGQDDYFLLDLTPKITEHNGRVHKHKELFRSVPQRCFKKDDLYTLSFDGGTTDAIERTFFGGIDGRGQYAIPIFSSFTGITKGGLDWFWDFGMFMGAQRFRTPRGLDEIKVRAGRDDESENWAVYLTTLGAGARRTPPRSFAGAGQNEIVAAVTAMSGFYMTMWTEGSWEVVHARQSPTKFIVTDNPVTFYCKSMFPSDWDYPNDCALEQIGTRTIFPLGLDSCLILTHVQQGRNPWSTPTEWRINPRHFAYTMMHIGRVQFGRELEEDEVLRINYILKKRATRYIAAANKDWLFPEQRVSTRDWHLLDYDWFLLPHLWKTHFTTGLMAGDGKGRRFAVDEYGRPPWHPQYQDKLQREIDWMTSEAAKREWAKKRVGKSQAKVDKYEHGEVAEDMMREYLEGEGLLPKQDQGVERRP